MICPRCSSNEHSAVSLFRFPRSSQEAGVPANKLSESRQVNNVPFMYYSNFLLLNCRLRVTLTKKFLVRNFTSSFDEELTKTLVVKEIQNSPSICRRSFYAHRMNLPEGNAAAATASKQAVTTFC